MSVFALVIVRTEELAPLLMPPAAFSGVALVIFLVLAVVVWSYRDVANRHSQKTEKPAHDSHDAHDAGH